MSNLNKKKRTKKEILFSSFLTILIIASIATGIILCCKVTIEEKYEDEYEELIESYYEQQKIKSNYDMYNKQASDTDTSYINTPWNVDAILRVDSMDIVLPVCSGNYAVDIEAYRLTTLSPDMKLGCTTYSIMGHHAKMLNIAFGWLNKLEKDTLISLEKDGIFYNYVVDDIYVGYAAEMPEIFTISNEDVVYMSTCDYSLGRSSKIVYRVVKCVRY